jgi:ketosteroid isomerase-like protein
MLTRQPQQQQQRPRQPRMGTTAVFVVVTLLTTMCHPSLTASALVTFPTKRLQRSLSTTRTSISATNANNPFDSFVQALFPNTAKTSPVVVDSSNSIPINPVVQFIQAYNNRDLDTALTWFSDDCEYQDATFSKPFLGRAAIHRHLRLRADAYIATRIVLDDMAVDTDGDTIAIQYHLEDENIFMPNSRHIAFYTIAADRTIARVFDAVEPASKTGSFDLALLAAVSKLLSTTTTSAKVLPQLGSTAPEQYFDAWNRRDMEAATDVFTDDVTYEDTVFPRPFLGKMNLKKHLLLCADAFPDSFTFVVDNVANGARGDTGDDCIAVQWHVENNGKAMPFTRGCSMYRLADNGLIMEGTDIVEPAVLKMGGLTLFAKSLATNLASEPIRILPIAVWAAYMYIVFFSDGILPGANALQLEQRTWEEVRDLSLNFFFVSPLLNLPFSPTVHPMLEGVFNLLLAWAALFSGFLSDDRTRKPNVLPMLPIVVGMQFLTSAFLLPYLATRSTETDECVSLQELDVPLVERRVLGPFLGFVGSGALVWGSVARFQDFGGWNERVASFWQLMSVDRVGSSFLVDLAIFAVFQGWLVDDDLKRRGVEDTELGVLRGVAKLVPFFGMAIYMALRPNYPSNESKGEKTTL